MILGPEHVSLTVSNLERSIDFYTRCFGFRVGRRGEPATPAVGAITGYKGAHLKSAHLILKSLDLELIEYVHPRGEHPPVLETKDVGTPHLGFTTDDMEADYHRLCQMGVRFKSPPQAANTQGLRAVYGLDPDGITFELIQHPHQAQ